MRWGFSSLPDRWGWRGLRRGVWVCLRLRAGRWPACRRCVVRRWLGVVDPRWVFGSARVSGFRWCRCLRVVRFCLCWCSLFFVRAFVCGGGLLFLCARPVWWFSGVWVRLFWGCVWGFSVFLALVGWVLCVFGGWLAGFGCLVAVGGVLVWRLWGWRPGLVGRAGRGWGVGVGFRAVVLAGFLVVPCALAGGRGGLGRGAAPPPPRAVGGGCRGAGGAGGVAVGFAGAVRGGASVSLRGGLVSRGGGGRCVFRGGGGGVGVVVPAAVFGGRGVRPGRVIGVGGGLGGGGAPAVVRVARLRGWGWVGLVAWAAGPLGCWVVLFVVLLFAVVRGWFAGLGAFLSAGFVLGRGVVSGVARGFGFLWGCWRGFAFLSLE